MSTRILGPLVRFIGISPAAKIDQDPLGPHHHLLIPCQRHFLNTFQHLGSKQLRKLITRYAEISYGTVMPDEMLGFISQTMQIDEKSPLAQRRLQLLDNVLNVMIHLRINCGHRFSLRAFNDHLKLHEIIAMESNQQVPEPLRHNLQNYLCSLPDYQNSKLLDEPLSFLSFRAHMDIVSDLHALLNKLALPSTEWLMAQVETAAAWYKSGGDHMQVADAIIRDLWQENLRYNLMAEDDLHFQFFLRGCRLDRNHAMFKSLGRAG